MCNQSARAIAQENRGNIKNVIIMTSKTIRCTCKNSTQDEIYGIGNRIANEMRSGQLKCTVCGTIHGSAVITRPLSVEKISEQAKVEPKPEKGKKPKPNKDKKFGRK